MCYLLVIDDKILESRVYDLVYPSREKNMETIGQEVQNIADNLASALQGESGAAHFALDDLRVEYEIREVDAGKVLVLGERVFPLASPLHSASAALAIYEEFINARATLVRCARDAALKIAAGGGTEDQGKTQRALAALAALPFVSLQTQSFQPR